MKVLFQLTAATIVDPEHISPASRAVEYQYDKYSFGKALSYYRTGFSKNSVSERKICLLLFIFKG